VSVSVPSFPRAIRAALDPERIVRHNRAIGSLLQCAASRLFSVYFLAPLVALGLRVFFRLKVVHQVPLRSLGRHVVFAGRHFYEWDAPLTLTALAWKHALPRPGFLPYIVAGDFWFRIPPLRAMLWLLNILCLVRDYEPDNGAMGALTGLFRRRSRATALIFPTGPIGRSKLYRVKPGIGWFARENPDVQIVPVTTMGVQAIRLRDVLLLRRPHLTLVSGTPFCCDEIGGVARHERELAVCQRVAEQWRGMEDWARAAGVHVEHVPAVEGPASTSAVAPFHA
jgi:1-acyl-sn-glycerol-3-phosphate acyltransferase